MCEVIVIIRRGSGTLEQVTVIVAKAGSIEMIEQSAISEVRASLDVRVVDARYIG